MFPPEAMSALMPAPMTKPLLTGVQLAPSSVERKTPPAKSVPAKRWPLGLVVNDRTAGSVSPLLAGVQLSPLSTDRKTPPPHVPAKMSPFGLIVSAVTYVFPRPLTTSPHVSPSSVER